MRWFTLAFNILGFLTPLYFVVSFAIKAGQTGNLISPVVWLVVILQAAFIGTVLILTANYFCEITVDENGLWVSFLWQRIHVQWQNIIEIKPAIFNFGAGSQSWVVLTRTLPPFHRLYGLLYGLSWLPSFVIAPLITDSEDLVQRIREHIQP